MFADRETVELLNGMAESHSEQKRDGLTVTRATPSRAKHRNEIQQHFAARDKRSFGYWNSLSFFLERSVFRAGLRVQCPICAYQNWFDLDTISYNPTCNRCLNEFTLSQSPGDLRNYEWFYRVIGPFSAPDYVRGGYAVVLTLRCIAGLHDGEITWSTGLKLKELNCEVDFAGWYRYGSFLSDEEREEPAFFLGEAKSFGKYVIDKTSVDNLRVAGERFPGAFMIISSLKQITDYSSLELNLLRELAQWGRVEGDRRRPRNPLIVLTGRELFSEDGIRGAWRDERAGYQRMDLYDMAEMTQRVYLGLTPFFADFQNLVLHRARLVRALKHRSKFYAV
jgi:hypothetical protein